MTQHRTQERLISIASLLVVFITALGFSRSAQAQSHPCISSEPQTGTLASGTPLSFKLQGSEQSFGISGLALFGNDFTQLAFAPGTTISISASSKETDRYGRITGQVFMADANGSKHWLQGSLLKNGLALVSGTTSSPECRTEMLKTEKAARERKAGIWADSKTIEFNAGDIEQLEAKAGHFAIVSGKVLSVGNRKTRLYLNFGKKWSQDFTALITKKGKNAFKGDIEPLQNLKGALVRVRGIVEKSGGPMIRVTNEAQIELHAD